MAMDLTQVPDFDGLPVGKYPVKVVDYKPLTNENTGNQAIEFHVVNEQRQRGKYTIWITKNRGQEDNLISLKKFASVCGVTKEEMKQFQYAMLTGLKFMATVEVNKDRPEFTNVVRADPMPKEGTSAPSPAQQTQSVAPTQPPPAAQQANNNNDDLPF